MEASKKNGNVIDHWAFLEHFEAPMWADLIVEAKSGYENIADDDWFNRSHPFHQLSARQLKSKFAHSGEVVASPVLSSSVSKSRGKYYNNKKWGKGINLNALLDKQEGLSKGRCFKQGSSFGHEVKAKSTSNVSRSKGFMSETSGLTFEHNARGKATSKPRCSITSENMMQRKDYKGHKKVSCDEKSKSSSVRSVSFRKSLVTVESSCVHDQHKYTEVSSKPCDQKSGSSSVNSISFRKSYVTQEVSKVEMDVGNMKSRSHKSSSGKSSVGSCSNTSYEVKFVAKQLREKITDKKDVVAMNPANKNKCNLGNKSKTSSITGSNINVANSLVKSQSVRSSIMLPGKVNKNNSSAGANKTLDKGKENATRKLTVNRNCNEKGALARGILKSQKPTEQNRQRKDDKAATAALTILGKVNDQCEAKIPGNASRKIYLR
ncbi:uncharacterized protein LOC123900098 [Trifolium pratense]|uniref:Uncharacterized protein n=2 Tax=Trifolium pratense TaxID=57577 RepID=A0ACB0JJY6_TRIPR|nr:uncharacterized protein LOC123900098 [Trifolium pratense]CAJ2645423.1 unnamed protein product [Trifolium pratense]